jgi:hypothetical protein
MNRWLRRLLGGDTRPTQPTRPAPAGRTPAGASAPPGDPAAQAREYLARIQAKISRLAEEFASGSINRSQFHELFEHYQRERRTIETWLESAPHSDEWKKASTEGRSVIIRQRHTSSVLGYAVYENDSGMPLTTIGQFEIDPALMVPMLHSYRSATREIFGASMQSTQIEGGRWVCFVAGQFTTLMALFSTEPATQQQRSLDELHRLFEQANGPLLKAATVHPEALVFPHAHFLGQAH